jgi:APA family basic amino acid/polyamine antiporter
VPVVGVLGCAALAVNLPLTSVLAGAGVVALGLLAYAVTRSSVGDPQ